MVNTRRNGPEERTPARALTGTVARELGKVWGRIQARHPELPDAVVLVAPGRDGKVKKWGHWSASQWKVEGEDKGEVLVAGELFAPKGGNYPKLALEERALSTLLHESAHALAHVRRIADTSRGGRYHNKRYRSLAEEVGLECEESQVYGSHLTQPSKATLASYARELEGLRPVLLGYREPEPDAPPRARRGRDRDDDDQDDGDGDGEKVRGTLIAYVCGCPRPRKIRAFPSVFALGSITCDVCEESFEPFA